MKVALYSRKDVEGFLESPIPPRVVDDAEDENDKPTKKRLPEADRAKKKKKKKRRKNNKRDISALIDDEADEATLMRKKYRHNEH